MRNSFRIFIASVLIMIACEQKRPVSPDNEIPVDSLKAIILTGFERYDKDLVKGQYRCFFLDYVQHNFDPYFQTHASTLNTVGIRSFSDPWDFSFALVKSDSLQRIDYYGLSDIEAIKYAQNLDSIIIINNEALGRLLKRNVLTYSSMYRHSEEMAVATEFIYYLYSRSSGGLVAPLFANGVMSTSSFLGLVESTNRRHLATASELTYGLDRSNSLIFKFPYCGYLIFDFSNLKADNAVREIFVPLAKRPSHMRSDATPDESVQPCLDQLKTTI